MAIDLTNKICLVTGASEGVGRGLVEGFARRGASLVAGVINREVDLGDGPALVVQMDVTKTDEVNEGVRMIVERFGRIDVLVNNAGIYPRLPADEMTFPEWRRIMDVNLDGSWRCCEAVIPHMKRQGKGTIINVGSVTLRRGAPNLTHYVASKGGIVGLTRGLARDLGKYGIRANCIHLGAVRTEGELRLFPDQAALKTTFDGLQSLAGRLTPQSVEPTFAFFASDDSSDVSGQSLTVDRGWIHD